MPTCSVLWCKNKSATSSLQKDGVTFHLFPKHPILKSNWADACKRHPSWTPKRTNTVCSKHFEDDQFQKLNNNRRKLIDEAIPTLNLSDPVTITSTGLLRVEPEKMSLKRKISLSPSSSYCSQTTFPRILQEVKSSDNIQCLQKAQILQLETIQEPVNKKSKIEYEREPKIVTAPIPIKTEESSPWKRKLLTRIKLQAKKIKSLQSKNRYLKKKVATLQDIIKELDKKSLIDKDQKTILCNIGVQSAEIFKRQLEITSSGKISRKKFSPELRCFALTLDYYSPKAYRYVRKVFDTALPHPRTLTKWYANIDGRPGFTQEALNALKLLKDSKPEKRIFCTLVLDEITIKESDEWHPNSHRHYGHVDIGFDKATDSSDVATNALVFLLVGINAVFKIPIGYFLIKGMNAKQRAQLVTTALELVHNTGVEIKALTCDGPRTNTSMAEELGCNLDPNNLQTTFVDSTTGQSVHFFLDPCHMLKLARNSFEFFYTLTNADGSQIDWGFILKLHNLQEDELFFLANKLRANHIYFKTKIMNVRLAAQLFSRSVAEALMFCETQLKLPEFTGVTATADFLILINDLFDILDSKTCSYGLKKAMCLDNYEKCFEILDSAKTSLVNLTVTTKNSKKEMVDANVLESPRYTGFLGFLICVESAKSMFQELIFNESTGLSFIPFHKISQDHIEILFSNIRSHGGSIDNPTARQFEAIYRKLLVHKAFLREENGANCIPFEDVNILNCSSSIKKINMTCPNSRDEISVTDPNSSDIDYELDFEAEITLSPFGKKVVEYIAGFVVHSLKNKIKCDDCLKGMYGPCDEESLTYHKTKGKLIFASENVVSLCRLCEKVIRLELDENKKLSPKCTTQFVVNRSLRKLAGENLLSKFVNHNSDPYVNHNVELARAIMTKYTDTRLCYLTKKRDPKKCIRHIYNKLIHFKNQ